MKYCRVIRLNLVFYLKSSRFYYSEFISCLLFSLNIKFLNTSKSFNLYQQNFIVLFHYFNKICSSKRKYLVNFNFLNILAVRLGSGSLKAAWQDWNGDVYSILSNGHGNLRFQVGGQIEPLFFSPLKYLESETLWVSCIGCTYCAHCFMYCKVTFCLKTWFLISHMP